MPIVDHRARIDGARQLMDYTVGVQRTPAHGLNCRTFGAIAIFYGAACIRVRPVERAMWHGARQALIIIHDDGFQRP